jgi:hypothetical protein
MVQEFGMTVYGLTSGLQWLQMVNGVLNLSTPFWWVCLEELIHLLM